MFWKPQDAIKYIAHNLLASNCFVVSRDISVSKSSIRYSTTHDGYIFKSYVDVANSQVVYALASLYGGIGLH